MDLKNMNNYKRFICFYLVTRLVLFDTGTAFATEAHRDRRLENVYTVIVTDLRNVKFQKSVFVCASFERYNCKGRGVLL